MQNMDTTRRVYCFIWRYTRTQRMPPTQREIADACHIATSTVTRHLDRLQILGYIHRVESTKRGLIVTDKDPLECPDDVLDVLDAPED